MKTAIATAAVIAFLAAPTAFADESEWYPPTQTIETSEVQTYFAMSDQSAQIKADLDAIIDADKISFEDATAPHPYTSAGHENHSHFDGYCPTAFAETELQVGTVQQFAEINQFKGPSALYDENVLSRTGGQSNLFAKADVDWKDVF